ncbi:hypothetical protein NQ318_017798 [Aromia moschata]|uniref:Uncharacterized protein n=1 Tax=Aromia moschata TaxID=1265417 RepID=A0AAV8X379_9CUCU|nr:hypothetical protein NQ318_017798 [Aromia moschata]
MNRQLNNVNTDTKESRVLENISKWQSTNDPLAPLNDNQMDLVYEISDLVKHIYIANKEDTENLSDQATKSDVPRITFIGWSLQTVKKLFESSNDALDSLNELKQKYQSVTEKN